MPFRAPFKINYTIGDLLYGYGSSKDEYLKLPKFAEANNHVSRIDDYRLPFEEKLFIIIGGSLPEDYNSFKEFISLHQKYKSVIIDCPKLTADQISSEYPTFIGRKCKAGIAWACSCNKKIHFVLDGIDILDVIEKKKVFHEERGFYTAITHVELRWVYRNRFDTEVFDNIQFWINQAPCPAPWLDDFVNYADIGYVPSEMWGILDKGEIFL